VLARRRSWILGVALALAAAASLAFGDRPSAAAPVLGGALAGSPPGPLFPADNWWSTDVSSAPIDPGSASYIDDINDCPGCCPSGGQSLHPDFGGNVSPGSAQIYGIPYVTVDGTQPKRSVIFFYSDESDGVDHATDTSVPFYPLPDEAITQPHWVEGGDPASVDLRSHQDRHLLVVDRDHRHLYELWNVWYDTAHGQWHAGSGAFFDMNTNDRRPETWTSADAAGLAMLPGLVRYDEVFHDPTGAYEIPHAFRVTVRHTNGHVYPASHTAGSTPGALPMGARLRLRAGKDLSGFSPEIRRIFRAMKKHGMIVADNGTDMYVTGTYDTRWDNDVLNPAFAQLTACDFDVIQLGWGPPADLAIAKTHSGDFFRGQVGATYTLTVSNTGATATTGGTVAVTDTLPSGLTATALGGPGWSCTLGTRTCTRADALDGGSSYPAITLTVNVASGAPSSLTNTATVSGGNNPNPANDTANDVTAVTTFADVPTTHPLFAWIEALVGTGITTGCAASPRQYCPGAAVTRAEMAVFLLRGIHGVGYDPPAPTGTLFSDVPETHLLAEWIEQLAREGITSGCAASPPRYCPGAGVTRGEMAVFLLRAMHGSGYDPPAPTGSMFTDVSATHPFAKWIEQLAREGITTGCSTTPSRFCPDAGVTRAAMAVFLVRAFNVPL
jgi:uncharacterized repeat protein (TIGR01451 family)